MKSIKTKDLMVPLAEYATVSEDATLREAFEALEDAQRRVEQGRDRHRAVLVLDQTGRVVGKLDYWDILKGLEPKYEHIGKIKDTSRYGFSPGFIKSMMESYGLWRKPLDDLCRKAAEQKVKSMMYTPDEGEVVEEDASLDQAIHQLVMGHHQSLLVTEKGNIIGVLRMSDVIREISDKVKACGM